MAGPEKEVVRSALPPAYQNQILRAHFQSQYFKSFPAIARNDPFTVIYVDRQISNYLKQIRVGLAKIKARYAAVKQIQTESVVKNQLKLTTVFRKRFRKALKELGREVNGLRNLIGNVLIDMDRKDSLRPHVPSKSAEVGYNLEIDFMGRAMFLAERRIEEYFFEPTNTVSLEDLRKKKNMLVHLYHLREMAKKIRDAVS